MKFDYKVQDLVASLWDFTEDDDRDLVVLYSPEEDCIWLSLKEWSDEVQCSVYLGDL